jgi:glycosyltransferase involved in cell wall biosynthesis
VRRLLREASPDCVIVANTAGAQAYAALATATLRRRPPLVHVMHEQMTAQRPTARWALRRWGSVVATGVNNVAVYRSALPGVTVGELNNFLADDLFSGQPRPAAARPVVGVLGRMIPEKGILEAVEELAANPDSWSHARIAAPPQDAAYADRVRRRVAEVAAGRIILLDWADAVDFIDAVDVVLVPSTGMEGQPTVILEALARARPVVIRAALSSPDFDGLPVRSYQGAGDLGRVLAELPVLDSAAVAEASRRFGPDQAIAALRRAATSA